MSFYKKNPGDANATIDTESRLALGLVPGSVVVNKFGRNVDVDTGTVPEDLFYHATGATTYAGFPSTGSAEQLEVFSGSVNDTSAGSGARTVTVFGLDSNYNMISETITLNGTTSVFSTQSFIRAHTAYVATSGGTVANSNTNAGDITIRMRTTTTVVFLIIPTGYNQTNNAGYTIPAGYTGILKRIHGGIRSNLASVVEVALWVRQYGKAPRLRRPTTMTNTGELDDTMWGGIVFPEKTDLHIRITSASTSNLEVVGGYDLLIVPTPG